MTRASSSAISRRSTRRRSIRQTICRRYSTTVAFKAGLDGSGFAAAAGLAPLLALMAFFFSRPSSVVA